MPYLNPAILYSIVVPMAKPIRATPTLRGKEAAEFLRKMREREQAPITKKTIELVKELKNLKFAHD